MRLGHRRAPARRLARRGPGHRLHAALPRTRGRVAQAARLLRPGGCSCSPRR
ncbi:hypothetical protein NKH77_43640 [Streptomyces sp. M19]